jgi:ADP-heptose:LPS heptosyltransferase
LSTLYNTCALFILPSLYEGLGLPAMEAMLCGAPVIGSNKTSLPEVIGLEEALFDPYSVEAISSKISRVLTDQQFRALLQENGKKQSVNFSWDMSAKRALRAMEQLASKRAPKTSSQLKVKKKNLFKPRRLKILAIKLDHLGDFILAIPALMKLKARYPHATFDLIIGSWNVPLAKSLGMFDKIFTYDFLKAKKEKGTQDNTQKEWDELLGNLETYDIAIDFRRHPDGRFILTKTKALLKVGYETQRKEIDQFLNIVLPTALDRPFEMTETNYIPMSQQLLALVDALPKDDNDFILLPEIVKDVQRQLGSIAIFPKAGSEVKEWPVSKFSALIQKLLDSPQVCSMGLYFANQEEASDFNMTHPKIQKYIGLPFQELAESLAKNKLCITNDSGGGHLASYLGVTPLVIFSGRDSVDEWSPQFNESHVVSHKTHCAPCHLNKKKECFNSLKCLDGISVEDVYALALELLGSKAVSAL